MELPETIALSGYTKGALCTLKRAFLRQPYNLVIKRRNYTV